MDANPDIEQQKRIRTLLSLAKEKLLPDTDSERLAVVYHQQGVGVFDAIHLSLAEHHGCDILLTVDAGFLSRAGRIDPPPTVRVVNPAVWILETT